MKINFDCVRSLMLEIESSQTLSASGKPEVVHLKRLYAPLALSGYSRDDCSVAAGYLVDKGLIRLVANQQFPETAPRFFSIAGITGQGYDYLAAVRKDSVWTKIKSSLGIDLSSVSAVIATAAQIAASLSDLHS